MAGSRRKHFIRDWMQVRNETVLSLSEKAKVTRPTIARILGGGNYHPASFAAICHALGITTEQAHLEPYALLRGQHNTVQQTMRDTEANTPMLPAEKTPPTIMEWIDDPDAMVTESQPASPELKRAIRAIIDVWFGSTSEKRIQGQMSGRQRKKKLSQEGP